MHIMSYQAEKKQEWFSFVCIKCKEKGYSTLK